MIAKPLLLAMSLLLGAGLVLACSSDPSGTNLAPTAASTPTASAVVTPLTDGRSILAQDARPAVQALARALPPIAEPTVVSITEMTYGEAMCGLASHPIPYAEAPVWVVAVDAIWYPFPYPVPPGVKPEPRHRAIVAYIIDRQTGISLQTFSPWPFQRNPQARCAP